MSEVLRAIRDTIQHDIGDRGLARVAGDNLLTARPDDLALACQAIAGTPEPRLAIVTGFWIPTADPPAAETDGPAGAVFLARALVPLGVHVTLASDPWCLPALQVGLEAAGLTGLARLVEVPCGSTPGECWRVFTERTGPLTHLIALERAGPSHTIESLSASPGFQPADLDRFVEEVPPLEHDRCHSMRGRDITDQTRPAHLLFEAASAAPVVTVGIGDGGNEIGMGAIPWRVIRANIPNGATVACRVATDYLIVAGISNWGAYGLAAGIRHLRGAGFDAELYSLAREGTLLRAMVERGPLVDGVTGKQKVTVDAVPLDRYLAVLQTVATLACQPA